MSSLVKGLSIFLACLIAPAMPAAAQFNEIDPNSAIDADLPPADQPNAPDPYQGADGTVDSPPATYPPAAVEETQAEVGPNGEDLNAEDGNTYARDDLIGAARGIFGDGAQGIAGMIEDILKKQGRPNAYIVGSEGSGALVVGARYGSGTLFHKIEGQRKVYWRGPSIGLDAGANAGESFVLVYNLYDSEKIFGKAFAAGEGAAYLVGGFNVSYLRKGDVVLIPVRLGVGLRAGINIGYMKFSKKRKWLPF